MKSLFAALLLLSPSVALAFTWSVRLSATPNTDVTEVLEFSKPGTYALKAPKGWACTFEISEIKTDPTLEYVQDTFIVCWGDSVRAGSNTSTYRNRPRAGSMQLSLLVGREVFFFSVRSGE